MLDKEGGGQKIKLSPPGDVTQNVTRKSVTLKSFNRKEEEPLTWLKEEISKSV